MSFLYLFYLSLLSTLDSISRFSTFSFPAAKTISQQKKIYNFLSNKYLEMKGSTQVDEDLQFWTSFFRTFSFELGFFFNQFAKFPRSK